jgi:hypothetical protein
MKQEWKPERLIPHKLGRWSMLLGFSVLAAALPTWAEDTERVSLDPFVLSASESTQAHRWLLPRDPGYLEWQLGRVCLKPLTAEKLAPGEDRFRFLWLRSFHRAALFELRFAPDGTGLYEAKLWEDSPEGGRWVVQRSIVLAADARAGHRKSLDTLGFFALPLDDGRQGLDGATWLFEAREGERANAVHRWSPVPGPLRDFGVALIEAAIPSEFRPIY